MPDPTLPDAELEELADAANAWEAWKQSQTTLVHWLPGDRELWISGFLAGRETKD